MYSSDFLKIYRGLLADRNNSYSVSPQKGRICIKPGLWAATGKKPLSGMYGSKRAIIFIASEIKEHRPQESPAALNDSAVPTQGYNEESV